VAVVAREHFAVVAREKVRTAHALRALPAITDAFSAGRLS
jgi:hypothetical protein